MTPYPSYKDSGLRWLSTIPKHWQVKRLRFVTDVVNGATPSSTILDYWDGDITWVTPADLGKLTSRCIERSDKQISESGLLNCGATLTPGGSIIVSTRAPIGHVAIASKITCTNQGCKTVVLKQAVSSQYLYCVLLSAVDELRSMGTGTTFMELATHRLKSLSVPIPPPSEQAAIVAYLDRKTADIERFIRKKKQLIALLNEQKAAIINRAVTQGLNPDVPMKASGLSTHPKMPQHWQEKRLKFLCHIRYGLGQPPKERLDGLPLIRATNVERGRIVEKGMVYVDPKDVPAGREAVLHTGEIVVVRSGAYTADSAIIPTEYDGAIVGYDMVVKPTNINASFLAQAFLSRYVLHDQLFPQRMRAAQPHLNKEELGETLFFVPPIEEQSVIADFIKTEVTKIYSAITRIESEIELIQEYRTTLISDAVTGKMDVRQTEGAAEILMT